jgi:phosphoribosylaminoimidazolecarboxamide formyltransferase/IMP cyclohydrolase
MKKYALISVSDKDKIAEFAKEIEKLGYQVIATGNTAKIIKEAGVDCAEISNITGFPEVFDGRVKTLHPKIFGGILFRRENEEDIKQAEVNGVEPIDIVCVNLYPFVKTAANPASDMDTIIENIDIGGPSLIRASAKNYKYVSALTNPNQYDSFLEELKQGAVSLETRKKLALAAFSHTANYDTHIANTLEEKFELPKTHLRINLEEERTLRYGENPHQSAVVYGEFSSYFNVFHGKEISYNNILDLVAAVEIVEDLDEKSCVIIKHNNPCGAASGSDPYNSYIKAFRCDPVSAYGGIVAFRSQVDEKLAAKLNETFLEIVVAPSFTDEALALLKKKKDRRLVIQLKELPKNSFNFRNIPGGVIAQGQDNKTYDEATLKCVTKKQPTEAELEDLKFAFILGKHIKSNTIVFVKEKATVGVGAGQMSRVDSAKIAAIKAKEHGLELNGSVAASDAFFPFADGLLEIIKCGATAVIQPGGSVRDNEVIEAADNNNITMLFTGIRHFKH